MSSPPPASSTESSRSGSGARPTSSLLARPASVAPNDHRIYQVIAAVGYLGTAVHLALVPFFALIGAKPLALLNVFSAAMWLYGLHANRRGRHHVAVALMTLEVFAHSIACVAVLGLSPGFHNYLWGGVPFILFNNRWKQSTLVITTTAFALMFVLATVYGADIPYAYAWPELAPALRITNTVVSFLALGLTCFYFRGATLASEQQLQHLASTDPLTGLYNRRRVLESAEHQLLLAQRVGGPVGLVLGDIDHFKQINDTLGHEGGDVVLLEVARRIKARLRKTDLVGRWGGEEFLLVLPANSQAGIEAAIESLREVIAEEPVRVADRDITVTMTFGVAHWKPGETLESSVSQADQALYLGKQSGRNCVKVAPLPATAAAPPAKA